MNNTVFRTLCKKCGVKAGDKVVVALSGGADSVSLLHVLLSIKESGFDLELFAAHINHNLRGEESQRDEDFVRSLCKKLSVELFVLSEDVNARAKETGKSIELAAREVRYEFFEKLSKKLGVKVATAHTLSDSQETMLYNITRGTTLHGLCSIPYKRDYIVRPLLDITRNQVETYCKEHSLEFVQDSTNFCEDMCSRNKLRLAVIPHLKGINEGFDNNFLRLRENLLLADDYMHSQAEKALKKARRDFGFDARNLLGNHESVLRYALAQLIREACGECSSRAVELCEEILRASGAVEIQKNVFALCKQGVFRIVTDESQEGSFEIPFEAGSEFTYKNKKYRLKILDGDEIVYRKLSGFCIGYDKIGKDSVIRTRKAGDNFALSGRGITKALRKLQNEMKIPSELRDSALLISSGDTILWAEYIGVSSFGAMDKEDTKGVFVEFEEI